jgi:hypothetical protein
MVNSLGSIVRPLVRQSRAGGTAEVFWTLSPPARVAQRCTLFLCVGFLDFEKRAQWMNEKG